MLEFFDATDNSGQCIVCDGRCLTCTGTTSNDCATCDITSPDYFLFTAGDGTCTNFCVDGKYRDGYECLDCDYSSCLTCENSAIECTSCESGSYLFEMACQSDCLAAPSNYYADWYYAECLACNYECTTCYDSPDNC